MCIHSCLSWHFLYVSFWFHQFEKNSISNWLNSKVNLAAKLNVLKQMTLWYDLWGVVPSIPACSPTNVGWRVGVCWHCPMRMALRASVGWKTSQLQRHSLSKGNAKSRQISGDPSKFTVLHVYTFEDVHDTGKGVEAPTVNFMMNILQCCVQNVLHDVHLTTNICSFSPQWISSALFAWLCSKHHERLPFVGTVGLASGLL